MYIDETLEGTYKTKRVGYGLYVSGGLCNFILLSDVKKYAKICEPERLGLLSLPGSLITWQGLLGCFQLK